MYIFSFALFIHWLAQAVSTQLSPISKLDVLWFATCMSSQQDRKTYIFSWDISAIWATSAWQQVVSPLILAPHCFTCVSVWQQVVPHSF